MLQIFVLPVSLLAGRVSNRAMLQMLRYWKNIRWNTASKLAGYTGGGWG